MSPNVHTRKRQYQPSNQTTLNSFFSLTASTRSPQSPPLDDATQSSLLSVGMRVRKSVNEGYKNKTVPEREGVRSPGFPFPSSAPARSIHPSAPIGPSVSPGELMPFCGLHKIGGLAQQPPASSAPVAMQHHDSNEEEHMLELSMSQSASPSSQHSYTGSSSRAASTKKRGYEDEIEDDMNAFFDEGVFADAVHGQELDAMQPVARLKSSSRKSLSDRVHILDHDDFEEAPFLVPMEG